MVIFNSLGQPVENSSKPYASKLGKIARSTVSPHYRDWRIVPADRKEEIWRRIRNYFSVPEYVKEKALKQANKYWRCGKTPLRKLCDVPASVPEKKAKVPKNRKKEDWERFVDSVADPKVVAARVRGKAAREAVKALHTTGRDGIARRRHALEQQSPDGVVSRSRVYLATHVYKELPADLAEHFEQVDPNSYELRCRKYVVIKCIFLCGFASSSMRFAFHL